jgi:hypothetical protein
MKKIFFITAILFSALLSFAQEPADALRYSWIIPGGTARQQAIGGAMGSLGGDISATFSNPAGLGFYKTGDFVLTPAYNFLNNKSTYYDHKEKDKKNTFTWGATGVVIGTPDRNKRSHAISLAINRTADFNTNILYRGVNHESSYSQKFLEELSNNNIHDSSAAFLFPFGSSLAINTYWIDTANGWKSGNRTFQSLSVPLLSTGLIQEQRISSKGGITEIALGGAENFNNKLMIGGTIGVPILSYKKESDFTEQDATANATNRFDFATVSERLSTKGVGINLKAGIIYKPVEYIRLGLAIYSPTYYGLTDKYEIDMTTNTENFQGSLSQRPDDIPEAGVTTPAEFKYALVTPYRIIGSASYVLREIEDVRKQKGFLTADIEYINYKASSFHPDESNKDDQGTKDYLRSLNKAINKAYKGAFNFRAGGELKFTTIMVRAGLAYYGNPYKNIHGEKGNKFQLSGGLGYRNKGLFVDLSYVHTLTKDVNFAYRLQNSPYSGAKIKGSAGNVLLTVGFKI